MLQAALCKIEVRKAIIYAITGMRSLKFIYSEKATKFWKILSLLLSYVVPVKSKVKSSQDFVAFSAYMNFTHKIVDAAICNDKPPLNTLTIQLDFTGLIKGVRNFSNQEFL